MNTREAFGKKDTWVLDDQPTFRQHVVSHAKTVQYSTFSDPKKLSPVWTKVGTTPWRGRADLTGGYGRKLLNSSVSDDAPSYFLNPERVPNRQVIKRTQQLKMIPRHESSYVLPGGRSLVKFKERQEDSGMYKGRHRKFPHNGETVIDCIITDRNAPPKSKINWGPLPRAGPKEYFPDHK